MQIYEGKFLVPQTGVCYRLNPDEAKLIKPILEKYGRKSKPIDEIEDRFRKNGGKKVRVTLDITVPCYLELEEVLKSHRALPDSKMTNIIKRHKYLTYGLKKQVEELCKKLELTLVAIKLVGDREIVYATDKPGANITTELNEFIETYRIWVQ